MDSFSGKVAVITGGGSGIGLALAHAALERGLKVALADIDPAALEAARAELQGKGEVQAWPVDVASEQAMERFGDDVLARFGAEHLIFNNAGVDGSGPMWNLNAADWNWTLGVNLWGVIHGVRVFAKHLIEQEEGHIINTASIAGLVSAPGTGPYTVSKHAVVALSECLFGELRNAGHKVGVTVLCPSFVKTDVFRANRKRKDVERTADEMTEILAIEELAESIFSNAMLPDEVAEMTFDAIQSGRFYVLPHREESLPLIERRMTEILQGGLPTMSGAEEYPGL